MHERELKDLLTETDAIKLSQARKAQAVDAAMQAYEQQTEHNINTDQGNPTAARPTSNVTEMRKGTMEGAMNGAMNGAASLVSQRRWMGGLASAAVMVVAVVLVFQIDDGLNSGVEVPVTPASREIGAIRSGELREQEVRSPYELRDEVSLSEEIVADLVSNPTTETKTQRQQLEEIVVTGNPLVRKSEVAAEMMAMPATAPAMDAMPAQPEYVGRDKFTEFETNPIKLTAQEPVSTFSIDVDTASYSFVRRQLNRGVLPQKAAVRLEEMVNYFPYDYKTPQDKAAPFEASVSVMDSPWNAHNKLVHIGIQGYEDLPQQPIRSNLVFLLDVSGSMNSSDKLPLVKQSMGLLLEQLQPEDTVSIVVYAGAAGAVLEPTPVKEKQKIFAALNRLNAGGSTAGAAGIQLAYQLAEANFVEGGVNRVILATDGDFNVGITSRDELKGFIERKRDTGIYLSVLGFGQGNYQDELMQKLAQNGNGIAAYIDSLGEAQKVLVDEATSMLYPIANDVKLQVEFNPNVVKEYRLLGYETRMLNREDFNNDAVDAGEIGAGHTVTAIYEVTPVGARGLVDELRYAEQSGTKSASEGELGYLKIRYKLPGETSSKLITQAISSESSEGTQESRFAAAVAGFAQLLKDGKFIGDWTFEDALAMAQANKGADVYGYRAEFTQLIRKAMLAADMN